VEVGEQREAQVALARELQMAPPVVDGDADHVGPKASELGEDLAVQRHLIGADWAPVGGIKRHDQHVAAEVRQAYGLVRRRVEAEVGSGGSRPEC
jgi:hypothetical protein